MNHLKTSNPEDSLFQENFNLSKNPFSFSSADKINTWDALKLYAPDPTKTLPAFAPENSIIRGDYGNGKTMLLKAIDGLYTSLFLVEFAERAESTYLTIPVNFAEISDLTDSQELYYESINLLAFSFIKKISILKNLLNDNSWFDQFKKWQRSLRDANLIVTDDRYEKLNRDTVIERVKKVFTDKKSAGYSLVQDFQNLEFEWEQKKKDGNHRFKDFKDIFNPILNKYFNKIIFLCDEVGSLNSSFFDAINGNTSNFETLINQFRTSDKYLYKIAIYPNSCADILQGARYGRISDLVYDVKELEDYYEFRKLVDRIIHNYVLNVCQYCEEDTKPVRLFFRDSPKDALEQLIYASEGIIRRFLVLTDQALLYYIQNHKFESIPTNIKEIQINIEIVLNIIKNFGKTIFNKYNIDEREIISKIAFFCQNSASYKFRFKKGQKILQSIFNKGGQDKVFMIDELEKGSRGQIYSFDYNFAVYSSIPTHKLKSYRRIDQSRSLYTGRWSGSIVEIKDEILDEDTIYSGQIINLGKHSFGFISMDTNNDRIYFSFYDIEDYGPISGISQIQEGLKAKFKLGKNVKGYCAKSIKIISDSVSGDDIQPSNSIGELSDISTKLDNLNSLFSVHFGFELFHRTQRVLDFLTDWTFSPETADEDFNSLIKNLAQVLNRIDTKMLKKQLQSEKIIKGSINHLEEFFKASKFEYDPIIFTNLKFIIKLRNSREHNDKEEFLALLNKLNCETMPINWRYACQATISHFLSGIGGLINTLNQRVF